MNSDINEKLLAKVLKKQRLNMSMVTDGIDELLSNAAYNNNLPLAKALLLSPTITNKPNINGDYGRILGFFVENKNLEAIKFLLTDTRLEEKADIHCYSERALCIALDNGFVDIVKYLLTSQELEEHADIHDGKHDVGDRSVVECIFRINSDKKILELINFLTTEFSPLKSDYMLYDKLCYMAKYEDDSILAKIVSNSVVVLQSLYENTQYKQELETILKQHNRPLYEALQLSSKLNNNLQHDNNKKASKIKL